MNTIPVIPDLKLQKVGKERERKKGGAAWFGNSSKAGFSGAMGGSGSGGGLMASLHGMLESVLGPELAMVVPKALAVLLLTGLAGSAYIVGKAITARSQKNAAAAAANHKVFGDMPASKEKIASSSDGAGGSGDSLGMVSGSLDGKTQAERDAEAAAAKAAADQKAIADAKAAADAAEQQKKQDAADAAARAAAAAQAAKAGTNASAGTAKAASLGKDPFGAISNSLGGKSGASLSSGFGFSKSMDSAGRLSNGSASGSLSALASPTAAGRTNSPLARGTNTGRGLGFGQLAKAAQLSGAARTSGVSETASQNAANAFQPNVGGDSAITGAGAGTGGAGSGGTSDPGSNGGGGGGGSSAPAGGGGGSSAGATVPGTTDPSGLTPPGIDSCDTIYPDGGFVSSGAGGCSCPPGQDNLGNNKCTSVGGDSNSAAYQPLADAAKILLMIAAAMLLAAAVLGLLANSTDWAFGTGEAIRAAARILCTIAAVLSGIAMILGIVMYGMGGAGEGVGERYGVIGALMTAISAYAAYGYSGSASSFASANSGTAATTTVAAPTTAATGMVAGPTSLAAGGGAVLGGGAAAGG